MRNWVSARCRRTTTTRCRARCIWRWIWREASLGDPAVAKSGRRHAVGADEFAVEVRLVIEAGGQCGLHHGGLPAQQRLTLLLVYGERFDTIDAGRVLDVPSETVGARLVRITASLADRLSVNEHAPASAAVATLYPEGSVPS